jgi:hypothetical protein
MSFAVRFPEAILPNTPNSTPATSVRARHAPVRSCMSAAGEGIVFFALRGMISISQIKVQA